MNKTEETKRKKSPRPRMSIEECLKKLEELSPPLAAQTEADRSWLWITTKVPKKEYGAETPKKLFALGFRATKKKDGHPIPGTDKVGYWGHACNKPIPFFRGGKGNANGGVTSGENDNQDESYSQDLAELMAQLENL